MNFRTLVFRFLSWTRYYWLAQGNMYLHSPFIFELYENTIGEKKHGMKEDFPQLFQNSPFLKPTQIERSNYGAVKKSESVSINKLVNSVSISKKYGEWIYNMVRFYNPNCVLETGTCLGIGTAYLASGKPSANVYSIDAHKPYLELASTLRLANETSPLSRCLHS